VEKQYVAIDLHRRRSLIVRQDEQGEQLSVVRIDNDPVALAVAVAEAGPDPEVAIEATYGWYWAVDALQAEGANVHLVHPKGLNWEDRRVKNDYRDCCEMLDRMRAHRLPEAWIAPPPVRELRELVRHRAKLVALRTGLKAQVHAVLAKQGLHPPVQDIFGVAGNAYLDGLELDDSYALRVDSLRDLIDGYDEQVAIFEQEISGWLRDDVGYWAIQALDGIGPTMAAIFVAEIGDVHRFPNPQTLCSWAGLTPKHKESDVKVARGNITRQGSRLVRWAAVEAVAHAKGTAKIKVDYQRIAARRGNKIARVAAARKLLTLVYFGLRDGEIRSLAQAGDVG
jgi:transposase